MSTVVTLAERRALKCAAIAAALPVIDAELAAYAWRYGGRFIRFGSTATGHIRPGSDVDLIADFADDRVALTACDFADDICCRRGLLPDSRPACWVSDILMARALTEGVVLR